MKKSLKGALLSGLVLPGMGQIWLKHYIRGIAQLVVLSGALAVIGRRAAQQAFSILEKIESEGAAVDLVAIVKSATQSSASSDDLIISTACLVMILTWVISIVDAYFLGRKEDLARQSEAQETKYRNLTD